MTNNYLLPILCFTFLLASVSAQNRLTPDDRDYQLEVTFDVINGSLLLSEGDVASVNATVQRFTGERPIAIIVRSSSEAVFTVTVQDGVGYILEPGNDLPFTFQLDINAHSIGIEGLEMVAAEERIEQDGIVEITDENPTVVASIVVKVKLVETLIGTIIQYGVIAVLILWFCVLGSTLELDEVLERIKKPWGVIVGVIAQFTIMPPLALALTILLGLDSATSLGLILIGTCPGGNLSNTLSVILGLDYALSVTMTVTTNILALGIFLGYKFPKYKEFATKWLKSLAVVILIGLLALDFPFRLYVFRSSWEIYVAAIALPLIGTALGAIVAKLVCVKTKSALTIGLETGIQNALLAAGILVIFYPAPEGDLAVRTAYLAVIFTTAIGAIAGAINFIVQRHRGKNEEDLKINVDVELNNDVKSTVDVIDDVNTTAKNNNGIDNPTFDGPSADEHEK
ncbi:putative ileal sodium/bile acid cotransporter [Apostichopus japonicus]|uniref:Putative ileal sodium/bile acid cotransporter n=1 Tax=Stichopus japonicus TaxID=307972 RepID=A0A2G8JKJ2_STIJA|nr:putative ileal sodium/bile acid cotransporter [Apostichopus japonicus]